MSNEGNLSDYRLTDGAELSSGQKYNECMFSAGSILALALAFVFAPCSNMSRERVRWSVERDTLASPTPERDPTPPNHALHELLSISGVGVGRLYHTYSAVHDQKEGPRLRGTAARGTKEARITRPRAHH